MCVRDAERPAPLTEYMEKQRLGGPGRAFTSQVNGLNSTPREMESHGRCGLEERDNPQRAGTCFLRDLRPVLGTKHVLRSKHFVCSMER